jgi:ribosomal protein S18 acetylase RimI-like enzyme
VELREARPADADTVRRVAEAAWYDAHADIAGEAAVADFLAEYYQPAELRERFRDGGSTTFVAVDDDLVGYATAVPGEDAYSLGAIYVHPDRQGEGVGSRLLDRVEAHARGEGYDTLRLVVMRDNDAARGFYEAHSFEHVRDDYDQRLDVNNCVYEKQVD